MSSPDQTDKHEPLPQARSAALAVLADLHKTNETVATLIQQHDLPPTERALATELALGVVRHRLTLAHLLGGVTKHGWKRIERKLQNILLLAGYQMIWLDKIPAFAAIDEAVRQAKRRGGPRAGRFVNAILRQLQRDIEHRRIPIDQCDLLRTIPVSADTCCQFRQAVLPNPAQQPIEYLALSTSHPTWLVSRWKSAFGIEKTRDICRTALTRPPIILRPNRLRTDANALANRLRDEGIEVELDIANDLVAIRPPASLTQWNAFAEGLFQAQDRTARLIVQEILPQPGETIVELCAGVGTKTTQIAEIMGNRGTILASDTNKNRLASLNKNCDRLGISIVRTVPADELEAAAQSLSMIDWILIDAPCSNTGVLARRPEARYRVSAKSLAALSELQSTRLDNAIKLATSKTKIAYSTCSLEPEENDRIAVRFSELHPNWRLHASQLTLPSAGPRYTDWQDGGYWAIWDQNDRTPIP